MLTNIVASIVVSLVTNVTERVPMHPDNSGQILLMSPGLVMTNRTIVQDVVQDGYEGWSQTPGYRMVPDPDPKQKWVRTVIKRVTTLSFDFEGQHYSVDKEQIVSDKEVEYRLERTDKWTLSATNHIK